MEYFAKGIEDAWKYSICAWCVQSEHHLKSLPSLRGTSNAIVLLGGSIGLLIWAILFRLMNEWLFIEQHN